MPVRQRKYICVIRYTDKNVLVQYLIDYEAIQLITENLNCKYVAQC